MQNANKRLYDVAYSTIIRNFCLESNIIIILKLLLLVFTR